MAFNKILAGLKDALRSAKCRHEFTYEGKVMAISSATLNEELKSWRESLGLKQFEAAKLLDIPTNTYKGWEAGRPVHRPHILKLALQELSRTLRK